MRAGVFGLVLLLGASCRTPFLPAPVGDLAVSDFGAVDLSHDFSVPEDLSSPFDFDLPDLEQAGDLAGLHGCLGYSRCIDNCETDPNCVFRCNISATKRAVALFNDAVSCGHAYCVLPAGMTGPRCIGQSDPPNTPSGTCIRCEKDAVANLLERTCITESGDCNTAECLPAVSACIKDGN